MILVNTYIGFCNLIEGKLTKNPDNRFMVVRDKLIDSIFRVKITENVPSTRENF